jgi:CRISPR-associated endonuclease/helicase Cas3
MALGINAGAQSDGPGWSLADVCRELNLPEGITRQLGALWGKSAERAGGQVHLLLAHMLDTAMVAERMWLYFLAPRTRALLDRIAGGDGQRLFMWLCGVHDWGKATPAFQAQHKELAAVVRSVGLDWSGPKLRGMRYWRHDVAGAVLSRAMLKGAWSSEHIAWVWPLIGGHHGRVPSKGTFNDREAKQVPQGIWTDSPWPAAQQAVIAVFTRALGYADLAVVQPVVRPSKADQLALSGLIVMADWIGSNEGYFNGLDSLAAISVAGSRTRAEVAWAGLGLKGGWDGIPVPLFDPVAARFHDAPRASQRLLVEAARAMGAPGLVFVEAPMGEGKTKAALAAAEILAARFGLGGLFVGMPTQATSDPMYSIVYDWALNAFGEDVAEQLVLLHGKRMFNREWKKLVKRVGPRPDSAYLSVDEFGEPIDAFLDDEDPCCGAERFAPADWFLGPKRGLLAGLTVGTIDQLLYAATRTKHVMLRFAGLSGKVVIVDEVHAADIYMQQFLAEALFLLGQAGVPVMLLSATLPAYQRRELSDAYLRGALNDAHFTHDLPQPAGYPSVSAVWVDPATHQPSSWVRDCASWREPYPVRVEVLADISRQPQRAVDLVKERLADKGVALVILNTVERAQFVYEGLRAVFGQDVELLHGRLDFADRAERTERSLDLLGPPGGRLPRPDRRIVVATQVAEQSFDVDADLLVTDIAPMDLLLQRIGRLHRHLRPGRPAGLELPVVVVTGFEPGADGPEFDSGAQAIYGRSRLVRTAAKVLEADGDDWVIPTQIPDLVADVYGDEALVPQAWLQDAQIADRQWQKQQGQRAQNAEKYCLLAKGDWTKLTLEGIHYGDTEVQGDIEFEAVVRDGRKTVEVVLVRRRQDGTYTAIGGTSIGANGEGATLDEVQEMVLGGTVRLPASLTSATQGLPALPGWTGDPHLRYARALVLESDGTASLGDYQVSYNRDLGLVVQGTSTHR